MNKDKNLIKIIFPKNNIKDNYNFYYDDIGLYSVSIKKDAKIITNFIKDCLIKENLNIKNLSIMDATGGIGGNTISFCYLFKKVISIEIEKNRYEILKKNLSNYYFENYELINDDCTKYLNKDYEVIFFDPPWGGPEYKNISHLSLKLSNIKIKNIVNQIKNYNKKTKICLKLPFNYDLDEFSNFNFEYKKIRNIIILFIY